MSTLAQSLQTLRAGGLADEELMALVATINAQIDAAYPGGNACIDVPSSPPGAQALEWLAAPAGERLESLVKFEALGIPVRFEKMGAGLDKGAASIVAASSAARKRQIANLTMYGRDVMKKADPYAAIAAAQPRFVEDLAADIEGDLDDLYDLGADEAWDELDAQGVKAAKADGEGKRAISGRALVVAGLLADQVLRAWASEMLTQARSVDQGGTYDEAAVRALLEGLSDKAMQGWAGRAANEALAIGRMDTTQANRQSVEKLIYTAAMDKNTCQACADLDGQEFTLEDAPALPNPECAGGDLCRCQLVPVAG